MKVFFALEGRLHGHAAATARPPLTGSEPDRAPAQAQGGRARRQPQGADGRRDHGDVDGGGNAGPDRPRHRRLGGLRADQPHRHRVRDAPRRLRRRPAARIELRDGSPTGELLGTAAVPEHGRRDALARRDGAGAPASTETMALYVVFTGSANFRLNFLEFDGKGISPAAKPQVAITSPTDVQALEPGANTLTATATDAENDDHRGRVLRRRREGRRRTRRRRTASTGPRPRRTTTSSTRWPRTTTA